jgi:3',5'-cyclic AMP phosphodiesterase CpdA
VKTLAHISDLHLGLSPAASEQATRIVRLVLELGIDHVIASGDITHRGLTAEWRLFEKIFAPLLSSGRLTTTPGNHDRLGDDVARHALPATRETTRVAIVRAPGLHLVALDSTGPHNRSVFRSHGLITCEDLDAVERAFDDVEPGALPVLALHHHPIVLPEESLHEAFSTMVGWPFAAELQRGDELVTRIASRARLVLHGHRHRPSAFDLGALSLFNAGSTTALGAFRVFTHVSGHLRHVSWHALTDAQALHPRRAVELARVG